MRGNLAFVGDVHLVPDDPLLEEFLRFLDHLGKSCSRIVFTGDLFTVWLGRPELTQPHHLAVLSKLSELRSNGILLSYIEGNHDFHIGAGPAAEIFHEIRDETLSVMFGGLSILVAHGDLANREDRRYRRWRRMARSRLIWGLFNILPGALRIRLAESVEKRMRITNLDHKRAFPTEQVLAYATAFHAAGHDAVILGHFHEEHEFLIGERENPGRAIVLPEWQGSRRHLEIGSSGSVAFVDYRPATV